jgi:NhaA family Na+:H+ antiporter
MSSESEKAGFRSWFEWFVHSEVTGSILLLACAVVALIWANSPLAESYFDLLHTYVGVSWGDASFKLSLHHWINDGLMVIFFFFVLNIGGEGARGWGIPMATDIAFALGILAVFGSRAPLGLKVFLTALAIADDLGAVAVIALFYTEKINVVALIVAGTMLLALFVAIRARVNHLGILLPMIVGVWVAVFTSGLHATVAGIFVAMIIPVKPRLSVPRFIADTEDFLHNIRIADTADKMLVADKHQLHAVENVRERASDILPSGLVLEHIFHPIQVWLILPLFALANAGVVIGGDLMAVLGSPLALGIVFGLVVGKPVGIGLLSWLAVKSGRGTLPEGVTWAQVVGAGCLAGIGFTMSL